jgi:hypothetical protein
MELTLIDVSNPIREWMEYARSTVQPELDEESPGTDAPIPSVMVQPELDEESLFTSGWSMLGPRFNLN